ncbi:15172_t:CDS:1, partial [Funneliformis geosporum]
HSGDFFNNKANILAKDDCSQPILQFNYSAIEDLQLTMLFNNTPIEFSSRKFWKDLIQLNTSSLSSTYREMPLYYVLQDLL